MLLTLGLATLIGVFALAIFDIGDFLELTTTALTGFDVDYQPLANQNMPGLVAFIRAKGGRRESEFARHFSVSNKFTSSLTEFTLIYYSACAYL